MADSEQCTGSIQPVNSDSELLKLPELLERGWKTFEEVDSTNEPLGSTSIQVSVIRAIKMLEEASRMVAQLDLFSRNEELEEIATADLKYLLLPALLGALHMKQSTREKRLETVQKARFYFMDFLQRCKEYNVSPFEMPKPSDGSSTEESGNECSTAKSAPAGPSDLVAMAARRRSKIEQFRQKKELEARLSDVRRILDSGQADDEVSRNFYLLNVQRWVTVCLEEIESIDQELEILKNMDVLKQGTTKQPAQPSRLPMKPFILTKDSVQAQVFGAGYPSLPTMTVNDWYEQHARHGVLPDQGIPREAVEEDDADAEETEKEKKAENDDEESLSKARNWDDWKDTHRRGYGNRQNMG